MNRIGDWGFSIGLYILYTIYGNWDYATIFSLTPIINENLVVIISICLLIAGMGKSAQLGLHTWLPDAMEGKNKYIFIGIIIFILYGLEQFNFNLFYFLYCLIPFSLKDKNLPNKYLDPMIGDLLGDGALIKSGTLGTNARFQITLSINNYAYLKHLRYTIYKDICTNSKPTPWPNLEKTGKKPTQYWFST